MAWVETHSLSFAARHEADDAECAQRTLDELEDLRLDLEERFEHAPGEVTVIVHPASAWLAAAHPFLPAARWAAAPAGRRYLAGWAMATELHVLNDTYMDRRAGGEDSQRALRGTAQRLYVQLVLASNNEQLPPPWGPQRFARYLRWAWLIEGAGQYYSGQVPHFRAAVIRRMREGGPPAFPPSARDAIILGGTVFDLLERQLGARRGGHARLEAATRTARAATCELAFDEPHAEVERLWRAPPARGGRALGTDAPAPAQRRGPRVAPAGGCDPTSGGRQVEQPGDQQHERDADDDADEEPQREIRCPGSPRSRPWTAARRRRAGRARRS